MQAEWRVKGIYKADAQKVADEIGNDKITPQEMVEKARNEQSELHKCLNGFNFLIIYGHHINGWFIAIPNWNKCTEAGEPSGVAYNATKLAQTHIHDIAPMYLAQAIKEHWESIKEREGELE